MNFENEVTVEIAISKDELHNLLLESGFKVKEKYFVNDIYYSLLNIDKVDNYLDILKDYILIREIIEDNKNTKTITYKHKEFDKVGNIIKQGKINCNIEDIETACNLFEALKYNRIVSLRDELVVYANDQDELAVQLVNGKHLYIEIEEECHYVSKKYNAVDEMKDVFSKYNIPIIDGNYFVKKAEIEMKEVYRNC